MNLVSAMILALIAAAVIAVLASLRRKKKSGDCSNGCSGCALKDHCGK
ncbi:MAG: FeoB-associated Cys-rich membrane protein [Bacteroidales bacterium]|nr:FeoB-associated Cys-rich membrane protein [Bacteroidales bacterium]